MARQSFSVAMSVYKNDTPSFFERALESITKQQTVKPNEIVLVVDGEVSDEINAIIDQYSQKYNFKVIRLESNGGLGNALRLATENCSNEIIARMDSDDVAKCDRFEKQIDFLQSNPDVDVVGGNISEFINNEQNIIGYRNVPSNNDEIKRYLKTRCPFNHMTVMFKKGAVLKSGGYLDLHYNEDYYLWIRMYLDNCVFANMQENLVNVRVSDETYYRRGGLKYFKSEVFLQRFMRYNKIINIFTYLKNCAIRLIVQVLLPSRVRGFLFRKFARNSK